MVASPAVTRLPLALGVQVPPCPPNRLACAPSVGGATVNRLNAGSSPAMPANSCCEEESGGGGERPPNDALTSASRHCITLASTTTFFGAIAQLGEHRRGTPKVAGSRPAGSTTRRGRSSVGRAPHLQCGGRGFDSHRFHQAMSSSCASGGVPGSAGVRDTAGEALHSAPFLAQPAQRAIGRRVSWGPQRSGSAAPSCRCAKVPTPWGGFDPKVW